MEQRLTLVTLGVSDLARATAFYEALGWVRSVRAVEGAAFFQLGGIALGLYPRAALAADAGLDAADAAAPGGFSGVTLAHNARTKEAVDTLLDEAVAAGGRLAKPAEDVFWGGYSGYFADPDGHLWEVAWNPGFPLDADGNVSLPD